VARASARLSVLIAEDQYLTRKGTRRLLEEHGGVDTNCASVAVDLVSMNVPFPEPCLNGVSCITGAISGGLGLPT
jgi:hypothetical protein